MKKYLTILFLFISVLTYSQLDTINIGTAPNDGTGESLRSGMIKVNIAIRQLDTAYMDRFKWDGGATGLVAATGRTSLGLNNLTNKAQVELEDSAQMAGGYMSYADGVSGLALKLNKADSALMAGGYFSYSDGITGLALKLNKADSVNYAGGYMSRYDGVTGDAGKVALADSGVLAGGYVTPSMLYDTLSDYVALADSNIHTGGYLTWKYLIDTLAAVYAELDDTVALETTVTLNSDSAIYIPFLIGAGHLGDTALFTDSVICGSFYNYKDTLVAVYLNGVLMAGTGTEVLTFNVKWHATFQHAAATKLNAAALSITSLTTGTTDASFANSIIPPGVRVWGVANGFSAGNRPSYFEGTLVCYKLNRSY